MFKEKVRFSQVLFFSLQKLKDVAFPQAEILKKALLKRFDQEYAQYLTKKVTIHTQCIKYVYLHYNILMIPVCYCTVKSHNRHNDSRLTILVCMLT